jgi:hypothetical protein
MSAGVVPESAADTLLAYAYSQPGVEHVDLEIDRDDFGDGKNPKVKYRIKLDANRDIKWKALIRAKAIQNPILMKAAILALSKIGAPVGLDESIVIYAREYLPPNYQVEVQIVDR